LNVVEEKRDSLCPRHGIYSIKICLLNDNPFERQRRTERQMVMEEKHPYRWVMLAWLMLVGIVGGFSQAVMPPLFNEIKEELALSSAQVGIIWGAHPLGMMATALIGGTLGDRYGVKRMIAVGLFLTTITVALRAILPSFWGLTVSMMFTGMSFGFIAPNTGKAVGMWFGSSELGRVLGLTTVQGAASWVVALVAAAALSSLLGGWQNVMWVVAGIALVAAIMWMVFARDKPVTATGPEMRRFSTREGLKEVMRIRDLWLVALMGTFVMGAVLTIIGMLPDTMEERGMSASMAGLYLAIATVAVSVLSLIGPGISDKVGLRKPFIWPFLFLSAALVTFFGVFTGLPLLIVLLVYCVGVGTAMPLFRALVLENERIGHRLAGSAFGLMQTVSGIGPMILPFLMGSVMDATDEYWPAFLMVAVLFAIGAVLAVMVKETGQRAKRAALPG
jgi:NNP family nitrate/nitrite transporter-like MFS transporter